MTSAIVQLAIGIVFVFVLVGSAASFLNELVAALLNWRAIHLERWFAKALGSDADRFFDHPLIRQLRGTRLDLVKDRRRGSPPAAAGPAANQPPAAAGPAANQRPAGIRGIRYASVPSYVSTPTFSTAVLSILGGTHEGGTVAATGDDLRRSIDQLVTDPKVKALLQTLLADVGDDVVRFRQRLESWFAEEMDRLSGWYKRRTKWFLLLWGLVLALTLNIDAVVITRALWTDSALRGAVVAQAGQAAVVPSGATGTSGSAVAPCPIQAPRARPGTPTITTVPPDPLDCLAARVDAINGLHLPVGWPGSPFRQALYDGTDRRAPHQPADWWLKALGVTIVALAAMQGGPFWFDLLGKLVNIRLTGPRPEQPALTATGRAEPPTTGRGRAT